MADAAANRRRCSTDRIAALPEEILHEVLSRVGNVRDLFMFAVTCRWWLRRFTDPAFLRGLCPGQQGDGDGQGGHRARLLGFLFQQTTFSRSQDTMRTRAAQRASASAPAFLPAPGSPLGRPTDRARALTAFVADDDGAFNYAVPLAARRGNVLMRLVPRTLDGMKARSLLLGICNPVTGERHVLPLRVLPPTERNIGGGAHGLYRYAIITATDSDSVLGDKQQPPSSGRFTFSQLLLIAPHRDHKAYLHSYSAATRSWSAPTVCVDTARFRMAGDRSAVVHKGAAHWLCRDVQRTPGAGAGAGGDNNLCMLSVEVSTARVSLTKLPIRAGRSPYLCISRDGKLSVACVYPMHVTVWTKEDEDGGDDTPAAGAWLSTAFSIPVATPYPNIHPREQPVEEWFTLSRGSMLVMFRSSGVFILDLEKKEMEKVMDCFLPLLTGGILNRSPVPYEVDLVEFFMLRLGNLCKLPENN